MKTRIFTFFFALVASVGTMFASTKIGDLYYNLDATNQTAEVTYQLQWDADNYKGLTDANIPASVEYNSVTYSVTCIGFLAFYYCSGLTSVTIPNSVTSIGSDAFYNCTGLTSVTIGNSVTSIGAEAFGYCKSLSSIYNYATSPQVIDSSVFGEEEFEVNGIQYRPVDKNTCKLYVPAESVALYTAADGWKEFNVQAIGGTTPDPDPEVAGPPSNEIWYTSSNGNIVTPNDASALPTIVSNTYSNGKGIIKFASDVTSIGHQAFDGCRGLTSVTIPNSVTSIGDNAFLDCSGLTSVNITDIAAWCNIAFSSYDSNPLYYAKHLYVNNVEVTNLVIPNSVTSIGDWAFCGCSDLTSVTIPNSVTSIEEGAFYECSGLTSVTIGNSVTSIGGEAFAYCDGLTSVTIPNSVTSIGESAFNGCTGLTGELVIPNSVASIELGAFYGCSGLTSIEIPNSVTSIGRSAFSGCIGLTSVTIPNSVTSIGGGAFEGCSGLTSVTIPNSVTSIGEYAFGSCRGLTSIEIPNSVTSIGDYAFEYCIGLTSITCEATTPPVCGNSSFDNVDKSIPLYVPAESVALYKAADGWKEFNVQAIGGSTPDPDPEVAGPPSNEIWYTSSDGNIVTPNDASALPTIVSNTYSNGKGIIKFASDVTSIGEEAFYGRRSLTSVTIPNSVTSIEYRAFYNCSGLTSMEIPNSVTSIRREAFSGCSGLTSVIWNAKNCADFGYSTAPFYNLCSQITSFTFGNEVEHIPANLCNGMSNLTSIEIPNSVTSIGEYAFSGCSGLTSVIWNAKNCSNSDGFGSQVESFVFGSEVETIPASCCSSMKKLTSITIPNSVTSIGHYAFNGCSGLTSVTIGNSVTSIGEKAFCDCGGLTSVTIPNSVTSIEYMAFYNCSGLTSVTIPNSVTSIGGFAFDGCNINAINFIGSIEDWCNKAWLYISYNYQLYLNGELQEEVIIPNTITSIGEFAFAGCSSLTSIDIPNSVTSIGGDAFRDCSSLTSVTINSNAIVSKNYSSDSNLKNIFKEQVTEYIIGNDVTSIGDYAFKDCTGLTSVTIPNSVTSIGRGAFSGCIGLTSVTIPNSVTSIGWRAFAGCIALTSVTIPNSVTSIGDYTFMDCSGLTSVTIPNSVTSIGGSAFYGCSNLASVTINSNAVVSENYSSSSFKNIFGEQVTEYIIGNDVTSIGDCAFVGCTGLTSVTIPNSVTSIGGHAFYGCSGLTSVTIPNSVTSIGEYAFYKCSGLTGELIIPNTVTSIGKDAFYGCSGLTSVTIPNSVTSIEAQVFYNCSGLTSVTIPNSVTSIGDYAFNGCNINAINFIGSIEDWCNKAWLYISYNYQLYLNGELQEEVIIPNTVTSIGDYAFYGCSSLTSVTIPNSVTSIGDYAFDGCSGLTSVTIPNSVTSIGESAFAYCRGLTSVTIPNSVTSIGSSAFEGCTGLTSVTIGNSVTSIGGSAFYGCSNLASVTINSNAVVSKNYSSDSNLKNIFKEQVTEYIIGNDVTSIGDYAFYECNRLTSVTIPNSITSIGDWAFDDCNINAINFIGSIEDWCNKTWMPFEISYGYQLYLNGELQEEVVIPNSITSIDGAFRGCRSLTSIEIPNSVTSIGSRAFYNCSSLTSVTIPNSVTSIGNYAFHWCSSLTQVNITDIAAWCNIAFSSDDSNPLYYAQHLYVNNVEVTNLVIPNSVTSIGDWAFGGCRGLTSVAIGNSVTSIGDYAFSGCRSLTSVTIGNSVTSIGDSAFYKCSSLTSVTIPNSVTSIGDDAFSGCTRLTSLIIGTGVKVIETGTFGACDSIKTITCYSMRPPTVKQDAFAELPYSTIIYVPADYLTYYIMHDFWGMFDVRPLGATTIDATDLQVTPGTTTVDVVWPAVNGAASYELVITDKDGNIICTLIFNANGQLTQIAFHAPSRDGAPQQKQSNGFAFTITGLDSGTGYDLTMTSKDSNGAVLKTETIAFATEGDQTATAIDVPVAPENVQSSDGKDVKILRNGQLFILRGEKTYTVTGQEVK